MLKFGLEREGQQSKFHSIQIIFCKLIIHLKSLILTTFTMFIINRNDK